MFILTVPVAPPHGDLVPTIVFLTSHISVQTLEDIKAANSWRGQWQQEPKPIMFMWAKKKWKYALLRGDKNGHSRRYKEESNALLGFLVWSKICIKPRIYDWVFLISAKSGRGYAAQSIRSSTLSAPVYAKQGENQDSSPFSSLVLQSQSVIGSVLCSATLIRCCHNVLFRKKIHSHGSEGL